MAKSKGRKKQREPIPESFQTLEEFQEFWDSHSLADYWDETEEAHFDVKLEKRRKVYFEVDSQTAEKIRKLATERGISPQQLLTEWLQEKLAGAV